MGSPETPPIWKGNLAPNLNGIEILGTPLGSQAYIHDICRIRMQEELKLLDRLSHGLSHQTAWLLLNYCAAPRANYMLRTLTPSAVSDYARAHDTAIRNAFARIFDLPEDISHSVPFRSRLEMPVRFGGIGLQSADRIAPSAYWSSWADSLHLYWDSTCIYQ